jgi:hypothetical protein
MGSFVLIRDVFASTVTFQATSTSFWLAVQRKWAGSLKRIFDGPIILILSSVGAGVEGSENQKAAKSLLMDFLWRPVPGFLW